MNNKKILIVEDDISLRKALVERLGIVEKFDILEAADGIEGLTAALQNLPDLILLDILMPNLGGMEMMRKLREKTGKSISIILLTNSEPSNDISNQIAIDEPSYFLRKSEISLDEIVIKIKEVLKLS